MAFPSGPACNLDCEYCYYLKKTELYPASKNFQMNEETLEKYIKQYIKSQPGPRVNFGWQGGEPSLRGLNFFKKAVELQKKYAPEGWKIENSLQTNAVLIDERWAKFLKENNFLVGVSLDGPAELHNRYRKDKNNKGTHQQVLSGIEKLKKYDVEYNILAAVNDVNSQKPVEVYQFFKSIGADFIQFIPIVEQEGNSITSHSVNPEEYGKFLISIFNEWINDLGDIYVQIFEEAVSAWSGFGANLCVFAEECGNAPVLEHNGDLYSCDHFVDSEHKLGNINKRSILEMMNSDQQQKFGRAKKENLHKKCFECDYLFICNGGCPKNRIVDTGNRYKINYLCKGYKLFFSYIEPFMEKLALMVKQRKSPHFMRKEMQRIYNKKTRH